MTLKVNGLSDLDWRIFFFFGTILSSDIEVYVEPIFVHCDSKTAAVAEPSRTTNKTGQFCNTNMHRVDHTKEICTINMVKQPILVQVLDLLSWADPDHSCF